MARLEDEDGIDGPFDRAMAKAMREDMNAPGSLLGGEERALIMIDRYGVEEAWSRVERALVRASRSKRGGLLALHRLHVIKHALDRVEVLDDGTVSFQPKED